MRTPIPAAVGSTAISVIHRAKQADPLAWERLAELYGPLVYEWGRRAGLQPHDAADLLQDVFLALTRHLDRFQRRNERDSFRRWLRTICQNKIRDHFRRRQKQCTGQGGSDALRWIQQLSGSLASGPQPDDPQELNSLRRRALMLLQRDTDKPTWQAFWRTAVAGESPASVADSLGMSVWAVYKSKARVLLRLREEFADLVDE